MTSLKPSARAAVQSACPAIFRRAGWRRRPPDAHSWQPFARFLCRTICAADGLNGPNIGPKPVDVNPIGSNEKGQRSRRPQIVVRRAGGVQGESAQGPLSQAPPSARRQNDQCPSTWPYSRLTEAYLFQGIVTARSTSESIHEAGQCGVTTAPFGPPSPSSAQRTRDPYP